MMTSEICSGLTPDRASSALMICAPSSAAGTLAMEPLNLPTAVRNAAVMTTLFIGISTKQLDYFCQALGLDPD